MASSVIDTVDCSIKLTGRKDWIYWYSNYLYQADFRGILEECDPDSSVKHPNLLANMPEGPPSLQDLIDIEDADRKLIYQAALEVYEALPRAERTRAKAPILRKTKFSEVKEEYYVRLAEYNMQMESYTIKATRYEAMFNWLNESVHNS